MSGSPSWLKQQHQDSCLNVPDRGSLHLHRSPNLLPYVLSATDLTADTERHVQGFQIVNRTGRREWRIGIEDLLDVQHSSLRIALGQFQNNELTNLCKWRYVLSAPRIPPSVQCTL